MTPAPDATILVVEDDRETQRLLVDILSDEGYTVHTADHGLQALDYLAAAPSLPHVILSDLMMPLMDGWALCRRLQRHPQFSSVPVVILSAVAKASPELAVLGVAAALSKPVDLNMLLTTIERVCRNSYSTEAEGGRMRGRRILIVDDDGGVCEFLEGLLQDEGYEVFCHTSPSAIHNAPSKGTVGEEGGVIGVPFMGCGSDIREPFNALLSLA